MRVDRYFRVFRNSRYPFIDVKQEQEDLTELVEIDDEPFILHPGEFVLGSTLERSAAGRPRRPAGGEVEPRAARPPDPLDRRLHRPGLGRARHARALERRQPADHDLPRDEDRPALVRPAHRAGGAPYGSDGLGSKYQGQQGPTPSRYWRNFQSDPRHRAERASSGSEIVHALRAEGNATCAASSASPTSAEPLKAWGCELVAGRRHRHGRACGAAAAGCDAVIHLVAIIAGKPADFERVMVEGTRNVVAAAKDVGRPAVRPDERARRRPRRRRTSSRTTRRSGRWSRRSKASGLEHVIFRPSFVFGGDGGVLPRLRPAGALVAGHARDRERRAAAPADLGRRRRRVLRRGGRPPRRRRTGRSTSAAPTG